MLRFSPRVNRAHLIGWREWGDEAFAEAETQDKPIALFVTAFWCGFCQRLDETTLSDDQVITLLNALFIPVRLEESQRPDVDLRYNQDGWPTISFLTPQGAHLLSVNYTPAEEFVGVLARVVDYYQQNRAALREIEAHAPSDAITDQPQPLSLALVEEIAGIMDGLADPEYGGYGSDVKLLHTEANDFALYLYETRGEQRQLEHVLHTLDALRTSRTFDADDGGFFRYSSRRDWQEPHPEKLLADQAALLGNYLDAWLLSGNDSYRKTAEGLIGYLEQTLSPGEIRPFFAGCQDYLHGSGMRGATGPERQSVLDTLVYCDANAAAATAYLKAWLLLGREGCRSRALAILEGLWLELRAPAGGMYHFSDGQPQVAGLLQDAVATGAAFLEAYAVVDDESYLSRAREIAAYVMSRHLCADGGFFDVSTRGPGHLRFPLTLLTENARAARFFIRLAALTREPRYLDSAMWALKKFPNSHRQQGAFMASFGHAISELLAPPLRVELKGEAGEPETLALLRAALTQLRHANVPLRFRQNPGDANERPQLLITTAEGTIGPVREPEEVNADLIAYL
jgi:uncharacterized protein